MLLLLYLQRWRGGIEQGKEGVGIQRGGRGEQWGEYDCWSWEGGG